MFVHGRRFFKAQGCSPATQYSDQWLRAKSRSTLSTISTAAGAVVGTLRAAQARDTHFERALSDVNHSAFGDKIRRMNTPRLPNKKSPASGDVSTVPFALFLGLICAGGFFGLLTMIFPGAGFLGIAVVLLVLFFAIQYAIWERWILPYARRKEANRNDSDLTENSPH